MRQDRIPFIALAQTLAHFSQHGLQFLRGGKNVAAQVNHPLWRNTILKSAMRPFIKSPGSCNGLIKIREVATKCNGVAVTFQDQVFRQTQAMNDARVQTRHVL